MLMPAVSCGVSEIRTRDTLLAYTRFPGVPLQPLEHHSFFGFDCLFWVEVFMTWLSVMSFRTTQSY